VLVPVLVFLVCLGAGMASAARWWPDLPPGPVGGLGFLAVCGLLGGALALVGIHTYSIVHELEHLSEGAAKPDIVAGGLRNIVFEAGVLFGLACLVDFLARILGEEGEEMPAAADGA
jgi:hypothetical protein